MPPPLAALDDWRHWPLGKMVLTGPPGAGKTHLAHVWAAETGARITAAADLATAALPAAALPAADLPALAAAPARWWWKMPTRSRAIPRPRRRSSTSTTSSRPPAAALLLTARTAPGRWPLALPDLASRLQATAVAALAPPDDALLAAVLVKLFADRQLVVAPQPHPLSRGADRPFLRRRQRGGRAARPPGAGPRPADHPRPGRRGSGLGR